MKLNTVICDDIFNVMPKIADKSIDMILTDMPYNTTACSWDKEVIPLDNLWEGFKRIIKDNGAIVMTASQPFTSKLVMSNLKMFKYEWIWTKNRTSGFAVVKYQPLRNHENVLVFCKTSSKYNPIKEERDLNEDSKKRYNYEFNSEQGENNIQGGIKKVKTGNLKNTLRYPTTSKKFNAVPNVKMLHPTQKPVALMEYLIKTYTNEGDIVFDGFAGSGTTGVACQNLNRKFILIEKEQKYVDIIKKRLAQGILNL